MADAVVQNFGPVTVTCANGVALVVVDHPPVNAMGKSVLTGLGRAAAALHGDDAVRAIVLTGRGEKAFMAGADISEFDEIRSRENGMADHSAWAGGVLAAWADLPQPVIAAMQASAVGGGLEIALTADLILSEPTAKFGLTEARLGLIPAGGGTQRLPQRVGVSTARQLMYLGTVIDAERAERIGLVDGVSAAGAVVEEALALAAKIARNPRGAVQALKRLTRQDLGNTLDTERAAFLEVAKSEDFHTGFTAFLEKRIPEFGHR